MKLKDFEGKTIHFIGVGGIGMSGIAEFLVQKGYTVSGSDLVFNGNIERLQNLGIPIVLGHQAENVRGKDFIVVTTDVKEGNPELKEALALGLPIFHRSEILALFMAEYKSIAIAGTHGKTTTTGLMGWVLETAGLDPTVINGGIMTAWDTNLKVGESSWCVAEADESDGSFLRLPKDIALITNIDPEHMDFYKTPERLYEAFEQFASQVPSDGFIVLGIDHPQVYALWKKIGSSQRFLTYGLHQEAHVRAENIRMTPEGAFFDLIANDKRVQIKLSLYGVHNVQNALGVSAVGLACGIGLEDLKKAFSSFQGVQRRFTHVGQWNNVSIIDDYAHHPVEIRATLAAAKEATKGRVIAVLEPHRYSRLEDQFHEFSTCCGEADLTIVLPVYAARERPREGVNHKILASAMKGEIYCCETVDSLPSQLKSIASPGDMVVCLGAGTISTLARALPMQLNKLCHESCV